MRIEALYVEDEGLLGSKLLAEQYAENIKYAVRDTCGIDVEFTTVETVEEAKRRLPRGQGQFRLVVTDMLFRPIGNSGGFLENRGREVILQARKTEGVVVAAISQGDTQNYPTLHEDALALGASVFRYKQQIQGTSRNQNWSGWDDLAREICRALNERGQEDLAGGRAPRSAFVVYGRNSRLVEDVFDFLRAVDLDPMEWDALVSLSQERSGGSGNPDVLSVIMTGFAETHGAIVVFSPDDDAQLSEALWSDGEEEFEKVPTGQPRPNVLLEAGYALGYNFDRTLIVSVGKIRPTSDLAGRHILRLDNSAGKRKAFVQRLAGMGFGVRTEGTRWLKVGNFEP